MKRMIMICTVVVLALACTSVYAADVRDQGALPFHTVKALAMLQDKGDPGSAVPLKDVRVIVVTQEGQQWVVIMDMLGKADVDIETAVNEVKWYARHNKYGPLEGTLKLEKEDNTPFSTPLSLIFEK